MELTLGLVVALIGPGMVIGAAEAWHVDLSGDWRFATGDDPQWADRAFDDSEWDVVPAPALWDSFGYADYDGYGWYRRTFAAPASVSIVPLRMEIGGVDDDDWVYINGRLVGEGKGCYQKRVYRVPPGVVRAGENLIAVRIYDGAMGGGLAVGPITLGEESLADRLELTDCRIEPARIGQTEMALVLEVRNKVAQEQTVSVQGSLSDFLRRPLGEVRAELRLAPGATDACRVPFRGGECTDYRLTLSLTQGTERWETFRYLQGDALAGPRKTWWTCGCSGRAGELGSSTGRPRAGSRWSASHCLR